MRLNNGCLASANVGVGVLCKAEKKFKKKRMLTIQMLVLYGAVAIREASSASMC